MLAEEYVPPLEDYHCVKDGHFTGAFSYEGGKEEKSHTR